MDYSKIKSTWWSGTCYHLEQLNAIITAQDVRHYAYILHDKDKKENSDELKKPHYHFLVHFEQAQRGAWFKAFSTDDMGIVFYERCTIPKSAYDYLIHDTPACKKAGKHLYDVSERMSTIENLDEPEPDEDEHTALYADIMALINNEITWHEMIKRKPKRIHMIGNIKTAYDILRNESDFNNVFRHLDITYICGTTEKGKTRYVMDRYGYKNVYRVTNYDHTAFDNYNGQDVIAFEEFRSSFKIEDMLKYLEGYPLVLPSRYNNKTACYTKVYIITNWALMEQYKNIQVSHPSTWQAFLRRIKTVYNFDKSKDIPVNKRTGELRIKQTKLSDLVPLEDNGDLPF